MPEFSTELTERFRISCEEIRNIKEASTTSNQMIIQMNKSLSAHAFSGELTAEWREAHRDKLAIEARERDAVLKETGAILSRRVVR